MFIAKEKAEYQTEKVFGRSITDDESDAFRHFVWACLLTKELGEELALKFLNAHEKTSKEKPEARSMDLANNRLGILKAKTMIKYNKISLDDFSNEALEELKSNNLIVLKEVGLPK